MTKNIFHSKEMRWIVLAVILSMIYWGFAFRGVYCTFTHTSPAGAASSYANSSTAPAIYFHDFDGTIKDAMETQTMLIAGDYRDRDGNKIKADGRWGPNTIDGVNQYMGDQHAIKTFQIGKGE